MGLGQRVDPVVSCHSYLELLLARLILQYQWNLYIDAFRKDLDLTPDPQDFVAWNPRESKNTKSPGVPICIARFILSLLIRMVLRNRI